MREIKFRAWVEMEIFTGMIDVDVIRFDNKVISGLSKNNGHVGTILHTTIHQARINLNRH